MSDSLRIGISKTEKEWKVIDKKIREIIANRDITDEERYRRYINMKVSTLINDYEQYAPQIKELFPVGNRNPQRKSTISPVWHDKLIKMSEDLGCSIPTIIERIILTPLITHK